MAFDITTAKPVGFNPASSKPQSMLEDALSGDQPDIDYQKMAGDQLSQNLDISKLEPALTIATGAVAEPVAGMAGAVHALFSDANKGADTVESVRESLTYLPRTEEGKKSLTELGDATAPLGNAFGSVENALGDFAFDLTGSPAVAATFKSAPTAVVELLGLGALKRLRKGTQLIDDAGNPTKSLRVELDKVGLDYDTLSPEAKAVIPATVDPKIIPGSRLAKTPAEDALIAEIKAGGKSDALAKLKIEMGRIAPDDVGIKAVNHGFRDGVVQAIKTASPETKKKMLQMNSTMRAIKKNERLALDRRPSDIVGNSVTDRIQFLKSKTSDARRELNVIANKRLKGMDVDADPVVRQLEKSLNDLDITLTESPSGVPIPDFKLSAISKDKTSQRVVKDVIDLMAEGGKPDALRMHKLKRQLDAMIDFNKKSAQGLTEAGRGVAKDIRRSLNNVLREVDPEYAQVNDVMSKSLDALGSLDQSTGMIDIFGEGSSAAIGQKMRALMSNQQGRVNLSNAIDMLDSVSKEMGGTFGDDVRDLVMFADALDDRFGTTAKTSFAGQIEQAASRVSSGGVGQAATDIAKDVITKGAEKIRGKTDFNAFEAMDELLKRGQQ